MRTRPRRGFIIFFLIVLIPALLVGLGLSSDMARLLMASHRAGTVADNVAMAGATGFDSSNEQLDASPDGLAAARARQTFNRAMATEMLPSSYKGSFIVTQLSPQRITVKVSYRVDDLLIAGFFGASRTVTGSVSRSASPCISGVTVESCAYLP